MARYMGTETVSADECRRVHTLGTRGDALDPNKRIFKYQYQGRTYTVRERLSIKNHKHITAQTARKR